MNDNDRLLTEYEKILEGITHWSVIESVSRKSGCSEDTTRKILECLRHADIASEICKRTDAEDYLRTMDQRLTSHAKTFGTRVIENLSNLKVPDGKGPNYERIFSEAVVLACEEVHTKFVASPWIV